MSPSRACTSSRPGPHQLLDNAQHSYGTDDNDGKEQAALGDYEDIDATAHEEEEVVVVAAVHEEEEAEKEVAVVDEEAYIVRDYFLSSNV